MKSIEIRLRTWSPFWTLLLCLLDRIREHSDAIDCDLNAVAGGKREGIGRNNASACQQKASAWKRAFPIQKGDQVHQPPLHLGKCCRTLTDRFVASLNPEIDPRGWRQRVTSNQNCWTQG